MTGPVTVQVFPFRSDAEIALARLAADGIKAAIRADDEGGLNPGFFKRYGVRLEVDGSDLEDAYESLGIERVTVPQEIADAMFAHSAWAYPEEACGLVAMDGHGDVQMVFCLTNAHDSAHRFTIDPAEHFGCVRYADERGWAIGGVFHSHVESDAYPSPFDIDGGADPLWINFIVGPVSGPRSRLRAFRFEGTFVAEVSLAVGS